MAWHCYIRLPTFPRPVVRYICIQILDQTAISTDSYHPGSIEAQERLRCSSPEIILDESDDRQPYYSKSFHANYDTTNSYVSYAVWSGKQAWLSGWTEQISQSSLWRVEFINLLQHLAKWDCVMLLHCLFPQYFVLKNHSTAKCACLGRSSVGQQ